MPHIPPGYGQLNHRLTLGGDLEPMIVTMGVKFGTVAQGDLVTIASAAFTAFATCWEDHLTSAYTLQGVDLYANIGGTNYVASSTNSPDTMNNGTTALPQNCAYLVKKNTAAGGRSGRGRMYVPGVSESNCGDTGVIVAGVITAINTDLGDWLGTLNSITQIDHCVLLHTAVGDIPNEITGLTLDQRIATQRRRLRP